MNVLDADVNLENISVSCRLCLSTPSKLYRLFCSDETDALGISLSTKVSLCTAIVVSKNDKLPQKICENCINYVNKWYSFRKKCRDVNFFLRNKLLLKNEKEFLNVQEKTLNETKSKNCSSIKSSHYLSNNDKVISEGIQAKVNDISNSNVLSVDKNNPCEIHVSHSSKHHKFRCPCCPDSFYYFKDLKFHKNLLHNLNKLNKLPKKEDEVVDPDIELNGINVRTRYEMKCCNMVFFSKIEFRKHYNRKHPGEKPFMCETCGKKDFISEETLKRHKILHSGKYRCEVCFKTFTCNAILILHKRDKHENDKPFVCDVCGKRFVSELLMNYHKRFHTGEKKYICEECGLAVVTSSSLAKHKRIHSKEKPHTCHVCNKGFIIKGRLMEHLRMHTGERPYVCQVCQKGFTMKDKLKRHLHIHSGEKLFSCEYCGNNYSTKYGLSIHLKSHSMKPS